MGSLDPVTVGLMLGKTMVTQSAQKKSSSAAQQRYNSRMQQMKAKQDAQERRRLETLKKDQASQRARFAGRGIGAGGGSADAVLAGLTKRSEMAGAENARISNFGLSSLKSEAKTNLLSEQSKAVQNNVSLLIGKK